MHLHSEGDKGDRVQTRSKTFMRKDLAEIREGDRVGTMGTE